MKFLRSFFISIVVISGFLVSHAVFASGNIIPSTSSNCSAGTNCSQFLNIDLDANAVNDQINWSPTNGGATVTDSAVTGNIWGDTVGWINLNPNNGGIVNTCSGILSGYAWGQNTGWINFSPTHGGVTISTSTGQFSGHAWSQNYGWIKFDCSSPDSCVKTTWAGCSPIITPVDPGHPSSGADICLNIPGNQSIVPNGYYRIPSDLSQPGNCYLPDGTIDVCPNIAGIQTSIPSGLSLVNGQCVSPPPGGDLCVNLVGNQTTIPLGYLSDGAGYCYQTDILDLCTNIAGVQTSVPTGYTKNTTGNTPGICSTNNTPNPLPECSDGIDNDGDGLIDYPADPGCTDPLDPTEQNPTVTPVTPGTPMTPPGGPTTPPSTPGGTTGPGTSPTSIGAILGSIPSLGNILVPIGILIGAIGLLSTIPGFALRLINFILAIPMYRKRRPWGIVYDSESKQTIDPAYVTVYNADTGQVVDTKITDIHGRYGFLLPIGNYRMIAQKTHYVFPSVKLAGQQSDEVYDNLYFGDVFAVTDTNKNAVITLNMPMDRLETDWNQEEKKRMGLFDFFTRNTKLWERISLVLFIIGFIFSIICLIISPSIWNDVVFALYIIFTIFQLVGAGPISIGTVTDRSGNPIASAIVRVWNAHLGTQISQRVTNDKGQYYILITNGDYYTTLDVKNAAGGYDRVYTSETMKVHHGVVNKDIQVV